MLIAAPIFDAETWQSLPFHFWTVVFFVLGAIVGSFLNVCIYRMPLGKSVVSPPSHCPGCGAAIRWYQNIPIFSWLALSGRCAGCGIRISIRYMLVELLTAVLFAGVWVLHGPQGPLVALSFCALTAGLVAATFIDLDHLIIPDEITLGGTAVGIVAAVLAPGIHGQTYVWPSLKAAFLGAVLGAGVVFAMVEFGKLLFGRQRVQLPEGASLIFTETDIHLPDQVLPYEDVFFRRSDAMRFRATRLELVDRSYREVDVELRLRGGRLRIGEEEVDPATVTWMRAVTERVTVPREAMGLGDVKFMAAIGAFTGWQGVLFTLFGSSFAGLLVNLPFLLLRGRHGSPRIAYGPYLAAAALVWVLGGSRWFGAWFALS